MITLNENLLDENLHQLIDNIVNQIKEIKNNKIN